ncbi:hypothetical protein Tco_0832226, partial [Tanacetum coccineum]
SDRHSSLDFTSDSSSSSSSSDSSSDISSGSSLDSLSDSSSVHSSECDTSGQSYSGPSTKVASPRLVDPLVSTPRCSEAYMRWRSAPLSTLYPPTTSTSSPDSSSERLLDSSSPSAGPSRKRCSSPTTLVPSSTPVSEDHTEIGTADAKTVADLGIGDGVGAPIEDGIGMGVEVLLLILGEEETRRFFEARGQCGGTMEIKVDPLAYWREVGLADRVRSLGRENLRVRALLCIERDHVDSLRRHMALSQEEFRQIRRDRDDTRRRLRRLESLVERRFGICRSVV